MLVRMAWCSAHSRRSSYSILQQGTWGKFEISLPDIKDLSVTDTIPLEITDRHLVKKGNAAHLPVLIKWSSLPETFVTWKDYEVLKRQFLDAPAWGQAGYEGGGNVTDVLAAMGMLQSVKEKKRKSVGK